MATAFPLWFRRLAASFLVLAAVAAGAVAAPAAREAANPGKVERTWTLRWPDTGTSRVFVRQMAVRPGYVKRVRVRVGGVVVPANNRNIVAIGRCLGSAAQEWLWSGRVVAIAVALTSERPARGCARYEGRRVTLRVEVLTVGT